MFYVYESAGYGVCSGLQTQGHCTCSRCGPEDLDAHRSEHLRKMLYPGYRRYLEPGHQFRSVRRAKDFNGKIKKRSPPERPTVEFWQERWKDVEQKKIQLEDSGMRHLSVFHRLPYFKV